MFAPLKSGLRPPIAAVDRSKALFLLHVYLCVLFSMWCRFYGVYLCIVLMSWSHLIIMLMSLYNVIQFYILLFFSGHISQWRLCKVCLSLMTNQTGLYHTGKLWLSKPLIYTNISPPSSVGRASDF